MARWLAVRKCAWNGRAWDPGSILQKDRVYNGDKVPPEGLFRQIADDEKIVSNAPSAPVPVAFSTLQQKAAKDPQVLAHNASMDPVIDGQSAEAGEAAAGDFLQ